MSVFGRVGNVTLTRLSGLVSQAPGGGRSNSAGRSASRYNGSVTELWTDPVWLAGVHAWVDQQTDALGLERAGDAEQPHVRVWLDVLKVPTTAGPVWFKANHGPLKHEAALVTLLADRVPDRVEPLLAADLLSIFAAGC